MSEGDLETAATRSSSCVLVFAFAPWCDYALRFLRKVDLGDLAATFENNRSVTIGAYRSTKSTVTTEKYLPGGQFWLNLLLYPSIEGKNERFPQGIQYDALYFSKQPDEGASLVELTNFVNTLCGRTRSSLTALDTWSPSSTRQPATSTEWIAASLLGILPEEPQLPTSPPCVLCLLGHTQACPRCGSRSFVRYGMEIESARHLAAFISRSASPSSPQLTSSELRLALAPAT